MPIPRSLLVVTAALGLAAVGTAQSATAARVQPYPIDLPDPFVAAIERGTRTKTGQPGPRYWTHQARYQLAAELDPAAQRLRGTAVMTFRNGAPAPLDRLVVHLYQDLMKAGAQRTRTVVPTAGFELGEVRLGDTVVKPRVRDTLLSVRLPQPLASGGEVTLSVEWSFAIPKAGTAPRMGHEDDKVYFLGYWYPQFAVHDDVDGWVADPHRGNGEFYMGYADYDVALTVPQGYLVLATGELQNPDEVLTQKAKDALARAMTTRDVVPVIDAKDHEGGAVTATAPSGKLTWRFRAERVRDVAISVSRTYLWDATHAVVKDKHGPGQDGVCAIHAVYEPKSGDWVRGAAYVRHTIEYMSQQVHPYPWPHMTACEGIIGGGMEYPMMTIVGGRQPADTISHEVIHMWFPMLVGSNEKRYAWLDEGLTSFWTTLCVDDRRGSDQGPKREILEYAASVRSGDDTVCMRHADAYGGDDFGFASYTKPAAMLHQLRALLGDAACCAAFRRYVADWAWKHPSPYDFFHTFADATGRDLAPYFRTWLFEAWRLDHAIADVVVTNDATTVVIEDRGRALHPCTVEATFADGSKLRQQIDATTWATTQRATLAFPPDAVEVTVDPEVTTMDAVRTNNRWLAKRK